MDNDIMESNLHVSHEQHMCSEPLGRDCCWPLKNKVLLVNHSLLFLTGQHVML